ncbi:copper amine oxidase-like protein [Tumebacillus sp. BK434]|uniref:copper amine oxidase N-terminal domain-containing protein n=1 Tax=Tumebacillus sp. BK434 TaxID=2512169 RepID=UPI00104AE1E9|nr:copper amine oxidase N-terminal domain-containing protein [Tumebacillus sp. BK434]TCP55495.1 copper amine oxidase-like protein [Tumebacillus sp. BK434]
MKKFLSALIVTGMLAGSMASVASAEVQPMYTQGKNSKVNVYVNGATLKVDQPAIVKNGRTLVPLRAIFEALGAEILWDEKTQTVTAKRENTVIKLQLKSKNAVVNGKTVTLDVPAESINYRTMVPVRFVSEALDAHVGWDAGTVSVFVSQYPAMSIVELGEYVSLIEEKLTALSDAAVESDTILNNYLNKKITLEQFRSQHKANLKEMAALTAEIKAVKVPDDQLAQRYANQTITLFENLYSVCELRGIVLGETTGVTRVQELTDDSKQLMLAQTAYENEFAFLEEFNFEQ